MRVAAWRSIADWKAALVTLPDGPFFDLMRGYLGDIRTPFNKQRLVDELAGFLGRRDIQETVAAYLDATDRKVIAATHRLAEPSAAELTSFFDGEFSYAELHSVLLNLEERLIIYRFEEDGVRRLALNPALAPVLESVAADASPLFPSRSAEEGARADSAEATGTAEDVMGTAADATRTSNVAASPASVDDANAVTEDQALDDAFLAATVSFLYRRTDLFKADHTIRKKAAEEASLVFPYGRFERSVAALRSLGVIVEEAGSEGTPSVRIDEEKLDSFSALSETERVVYLAAALCAVELGVESGRNETEPEQAETAPTWTSGRVARERLAAWARLFDSFLGELDPSRVYPRTTLSRILDVRERAQAEGQRRRWGGRGLEATTELRSGFDPSAFRRAAIRALELSHALVRRGVDSWSLAPGRPVLSAEQMKPVVSIDSSFSVLVYPEIGFPDAIALARFLDVRDAGQTTRFELSRESAVRGFDLGLDTEGMLSILERLSRLSIAQNVHWSLREWKDRYASVAIFRGTVLVVAEDRRYLVETEAVARLVARVLAPGVYLLSVSDESEAVRALAKAGVDIVALPPVHTPPERGGADTRFSPFPSLGQMRRAAEPVLQVEERTAHESEPQPAPPAASPDAAEIGEAKAVAETGEGKTAAMSVEDRLSALRSTLERKGLPKDQRDELALRIDRRVVLTPTQLVGAAVRYEKLEAKGLDYVGKVRVAEQAIAAGSLVEIFWRGSKGEPNRALGAPAALEKSSGEVELVLDTAPRGERIRIAVGKISLLRRIKRSIFGE